MCKITKIKILMIKDSKIKRLNQAENFVELTKASPKFHLLCFEERPPKIQ